MKVKSFKKDENKKLNKSISSPVQNLSEPTILKAILDNTPENIILIDSDYKIIAYNEVIKNTLYDYFGKNIQIGEDYREYVVPELKEIFLETFSKALHGEIVEMELQTKFETVVHWFQYKLNPVYTTDGILLGVSLSGINIDKRKEAEQAIKKSEEKFRRIIESATNPIIIINQDFKIILFNPEGEAVFGFNYKSYFFNRLKNLLMRVGEMIFYFF